MVANSKSKAEGALFKLTLGGGGKRETICQFILTFYRWLFNSAHLLILNIVAKCCTATCGVVATAKASRRKAYIDQ